MGCLIISVSLVTSDLNVSYRIASKPTSISVGRVPSDLNVSCEIASKDASISINRIHSDLNVSCGVVCSLTEVLYLNVSPQEVQWITDDVGIFYSVSSNTIWTIE